MTGACNYGVRRPVPPRASTRNIGSAITIECEDVRGAPLFGLWVGSFLTIDYPDYEEEPAGQPQTRAHVPGTLHWLDADSNEVPQAGAVWRCYRPRLTVMLTTPWEQRHDAWNATVRWTINWRET